MKRDIQSLHHRILMMSLLPSLLISIIMGSSYLLVRFNELDNQFLNNARNYSYQQAVMVAHLQLDHHSTDEMHALLSLMLEDPDTYAVSFFDQQKRLVLHSGSRHHSPIIPAGSMNNDQAFVKHDKSLQAFTPVIDPDTGMISGWLLIEFSTTRSWMIKYQSIVASLLLIIGCIILSMVISTRLGKAVTLPLRNLVKSLTDMCNGQFSTRLSEHPASLAHSLEITINDLLDYLQKRHLSMTESIQQSHDELQETLETIEIQNVELDLARKKAIEASNAKSKFLANMSHEIRTPLNAILGFANLMQDSRLTPQQYDYITTIEKSSQGMLSMLNNILDYSRVEAGKLELTPLPMNLRRLIEDVLIMFAPSAHDKDVEIISFIYDDVPQYIVADFQRLKQILTNLVSNAVKFTYSGSIVVRAQLEHTEKQWVTLRISVTDTGIGLTPEQQNSMFEAFTQVAANHKNGGAGLGLSISKKLTEEMGGEIGLHSAPDEGSSFWFTFQTRISEENQAEPVDILKDKKIALIVTSELSRLSISHQLRNLGGTSVCYDSLQQLTEQEIEQQRLDLAIVSQRLIDSDHFLEQAEDYTRHFPVILLTRADCNALTNTDLPNRVETLLQPVSQTRLIQILSNHNEQPALPSQLNKRILIIDDNPINLKLLETVLSSLHASVTSAKDGFEAITVCQQKSFDLILMDVQMPDMDGMETTRHIRALDNHNQQTPIVAVTAHALANERKKILKSGMNDYLTKPINKAVLIATINRWTSPGQIAESRVNKTLNYPEKASSPVNMEHAISLASGNKDLAMEMLSLLKDELPDDLDILNNCWNNDDFNGLLERVHRMNGASRYCAVPELVSACEALEILLKNGNTTKTSEITSSYHQLIEAAIRIQQWQHEAEKIT